MVLVRLSRVALFLPFSKMKLSKSAQALYENSALSAIAAKLVGEFAGTDVALLPGAFHYTLTDGRFSYRYMTHGDRMCAQQVGENRHLHCWRIKRRTPCSYVTAYDHTVVVVHGRHGVCRKFTFEFPRLKGMQRRFFPGSNLDVQTHLKEYVKMFETMPECGISHSKFGNFFLTFTEDPPFVSALPTFAQPVGW